MLAFVAQHLWVWLIVAGCSFGFAVVNSGIHKTTVEINDEIERYGLEGDDEKEYRERRLRKLAREPFSRSTTAAFSSATLFAGLFVTAVVLRIVGY